MSTWRAEGVQTLLIHHLAPISSQILKEIKYLNSVCGMASCTVTERTHIWQYRFVKNIPILCQWRRNHLMGAQILEFRDLC